MKTRNIIHFLFPGIISLLFASCDKSNDITSPIADSGNSLKSTGAWVNVFTDNFNDTTSFNNWTRTGRFDYNSNYCLYDASVPAIGNYDYKDVLVLTATKSGSIWKSGHIKSNYSFKPAPNEEYRVSASIKLIAMDGSNYVGFADTYGVWPAFWTVQESGWPKYGEIDVMEGYSYGTYARFAGNLFYGKTTGVNLLGTSCERAYSVSEGWHTYDEYWKNTNGVVSVSIQLDGVTVASYTNSANKNLKLENFGPHNIILNLNVGDNYGIFDKSKINVFSKTMMWVDYVTVDKRTV